MRIPKKFLVLLCTVALIVSLMPMSALAATAYNSSVVSNTIPATMTPGQVAYAKVEFKNTGANTWTAARGIQLKETDSLKLLPYAYKLGASDSIKKNQSKAFTVKITAPATAGTYNLSLQLYRNGTKFGAAITKAIIVKSAVKTLSSIAVTTQPTKLTYVAGEALDLTGLVVTGTYTDGSKAPLTIALTDVTGYNKDTVGEQTLTITKNTKTTTFKVTVKAAGAVSAQAISATQVLVKFNVVMDETDAKKPANYGGALAGGTVAFQADKKSVIVTTAAEIKGTVLYIVNPIKLAAPSTASSAIFTAVETYADKVAPTVLSVTYPVFDQAKITFSEPMQALGTVSFSQNGAAIPGGVAIVGAFNAGDSSVTYNLVNAAVDKPITMSIQGAYDMAGAAAAANLINPNPAVLTLTKTKSDTVVPTVVDAVPLSDTKVQFTFSEKLSANPTTVTVVQGASTVAVSFPAYDATKENKVFVGTLASSITGIASIRIAALGYTDMSGNQGAAYAKLATFAADNAKPTVSSVEVKQFGSKLYAVIHFNEDLVVPAAPDPGKPVTISGTRVSGVVTYDFNKVAPAVNATIYSYTKANGADADDAKSIMFEITSDTTFPQGSYSVTLPAASATDLATNDNAAATIAFVKGSLTPVADTTAPTVGNPTIAADNSTFTFVFSEDVDSSALNVANYKVGGATIFSSAMFYNNQATVKLTVAPGSLTISGLYNVVVSGIKDKAGNLMTAYSQNLSLTENVKPFAVSAVLTSPTAIDLTFSENLAATPVNADIEVYVNGTKVTLAANAVSVKTASTVYTIAVPAGAITSLTDNVQVKIVGTAIADANGNILVPGVSVAVAH